MEGGTTFHFVDADPVSALEQARALAGGLDVRIGGGTSTVRQLLEADLLDHVHIVLVPIVLGWGERLWDGLEALEERFDIGRPPPRMVSSIRSSPAAGRNQPFTS